ncbi:MAG: hydroxyisourate hydrolase [Alphaproteobacteria bacterium]
MGRLTTHVLDLASGRPAAGLGISLTRLDGGEAQVAAGLTNADGRIDGPLVEGSSFGEGTYELRFAVGDYLRNAGHATPFYEVIPIRFTVADATQHFHIPLLLSPYGYSTYRGS